MAESLETKLAISIADIVLPGLNNGIQERVKRTPIGGILYDSRKKIVVLGEAIGDDDKGRLIAYYTDTPKNWDTTTALKGSQRIHDLGNFQEIFVAQVGLEDVKIKTYDSVTPNPSVAIEIPYRDPVSGDETIFPVDEEDFLGVFTRETGGLLVFRGMNLPEENALLVEKNAKNIRQGIVFFFHPEESSYGIHSQQGLLEFLRRLNTEFTDKAGNDSQNAALEALQDQVSAGRLGFNSDVRNELFKTMVIANARMAGRPNSHPKYELFLQTYLYPPKTSRGFSLRDLIRRKTPTPPSGDITVEAGKLVDSLAYIRPPLPPLTKEEQREIILKQLKTPQLRSLRESIGNYFGTDNVPMRTYLIAIFNKITYASTSEELNDLVLLVNELANSAYNNQIIIYRFNLSQKDDKLEFPFEPGFGGVNRASASRLVADMHAAIIAQKNALSLNNPS